MTSILDISTIDSFPGTGMWRRNALLPASTTRLYYAVDTPFFLSGPYLGGQSSWVLTIRDSANPTTKYEAYKITGFELLNNYLRVDVIYMTSTILPITPGAICNFARFPDLWKDDDVEDYLACTMSTNSGALAINGVVPFDTVQVQTGGFMVHSGNQVTLQPGTYVVELGIKADPAGGPASRNVGVWNVTAAVALTPQMSFTNGSADFTASVKIAMLVATPTTIEVRNLTATMNQIFALNAYWHIRRIG